MALVAVDAVVDIARDVVVVEVVWVVPSVASRALKNRVVVRVSVTGGAYVIRAAMVSRERRVLRVVEGRAGPTGRVMAVLARSREELGLCRMSGVRRIVVVRLMASDTSGRQRCVVAVDVTITTLPGRHEVRTGKGEGGVVVIEG